jgi:surface protein
MQIARKTFDIIKSDVLQGSKVILDVEEEGLDERTILSLDAATKISASGKTCFCSSDGTEHCFAEAQLGQCDSLAVPEGRRQLFQDEKLMALVANQIQDAVAKVAVYCFPNRDTLRTAVDNYISQNCATTNTSCATRTQYGDIGTWCVNLVTDMYSMFHGKSSFNSDISKWEVGQVKDMNCMFYGASKFNQNISNWNVGRVTNMDSMFSYASSFNSDISKWNVSAVTDMDAMFYKASKFNANISNWNVGRVTSMSNMFAYASSFNSDISKWNVWRVHTMTAIFYSASKFNQNLCPWGDKLRLAFNYDSNRNLNYFYGGNNAGYMFENSGCPNKNSPFIWYGPWCNVKICP